MKDYKVLFADLDGTLIDTISGETFPKGVWDMRFKFDVLDKIRELKPEAIMIVSNQGGIEKGLVEECHFVDKIRYIASAIKEYTGVKCCWYEYCSSNDKSNEFRKPNVGMLEKTFRWVNSGLRFTECGIVPLTLKDCLMIGDASGKQGQFSDSDKKTAENFGIDYLDVDDFVSV